MKKTTNEYKLIESAYEHFNRHLFKNNLPPVFFTYRRKAGAAAIFTYESFKKRHSKEKDAKMISEISLNPNVFNGYSDIEILSHLVHEMCHVWQAYFGDPTRGGYHNKEWADKMKSIGLMPSSTGKPGGKKTGQRMSDYIIKGHDKFEKQSQWLIEQGFKISWESFGNGSKKAAGAAKKNKIKYTCSGCGLNAWGKPDLNIKCGECDLQLISEV